MNPDLAIPNGLTAQGKKAAHAILNLLERQDSTYTGGCKAFYSPKEWRERGEAYGTDSVLIVVHDGGDLAYRFNYDHGCFGLVNEMAGALNEVGFYAEPCTSWYSAIYPCSR